MMMFICCFLANYILFINKEGATGVLFSFILGHLRHNLSKMSMGDINNANSKVEDSPSSVAPTKKIMTNSPNSSDDSSTPVSPTLTFGTLTRPGVSFKNAVTPVNSSTSKANVIVMSDELPSPISSPAPSSNGGGNRHSRNNSPKKPQENFKNSTGPIKFGSFPSNSLPPRVHSAPPSSSGTPPSTKGNILAGEAPNRVPYAAGSFVPPAASTTTTSTVNRYGNAPPPQMISGSDGMFVPPPPITSFISSTTNASTTSSSISNTTTTNFTSATKIAPKKSVKISLVNPTTGKDILLKEGVNEAPVSAIAKKDEPKQEKEEKEAVVELKEEKKYVLPARKSTIKLTLVDPRDNKEIDLKSLASSPPLKFSSPSAATAVAVESLEPKPPVSMPTLEEIVNGKGNGHNDDDDDDDDEISFGDDSFDDDEDDDDDNDFYSEDEDACLEMLDDPSIEFPVILTREISRRVIYPEGKEAFEFPPKEGDVMRYSSTFLLQFLEHCKGVAQDIKAIAFPKEIDQMNNGRSRKDIDRIRRESGSSSSSSGPVSNRRPYKSHSSKRRNGQQRHYTLEEKTLKNRAANAWTTAKNQALDADIILLREVKGLLNKLSEANFDTLAQKICSLGILTSVAITGVIDLLFDKAVEEPKFAPLYAKLCSHICRFEIEEKKSSLTAAERIMSDSTPSANKSIFRKYLVTKIQIEYEAKRAYSQARLEKLAQDSGKDVSIGSDNKTSLVSGELTEADYAMIKTKRRVLGNMRFIGEIFIIGLISSKIMQHVITELLTEVEQPEEEEVESVCRLITTIGHALHICWDVYASKLEILSKNKVLSTRVRFMVMDVLELKNSGWNKAGGAPAKPAAAAASPKIAQRPPTPQQKRMNVGDSRANTIPSTSNAPLSPVPIRGSSGSNISGSHNRPRQSSITPTPKSPSSPATGTSKPPSPSNGATTFAASVTPTSTKFQVKPIIRKASPDAVSAPPSPTTSTSTSETAKPFNSKMLKTLVELFDESRDGSSSSKDAAIALIIENNAVNMIPLLSGLILETMEFGGRKAFTYLCDDFIIDPRLRLNISLCLRILVLSFKTLDDFVTDVPMAMQFAAQIINAMAKNEWITLSTLMSGPFLSLGRRAPNLVVKVLLLWAAIEGGVAEPLQISKSISHIMPAKEDRMALGSFASRICLSESQGESLLLLK